MSPPTYPRNPPPTNQPQPLPDLLDASPPEDPSAARSLADGLCPVRDDPMQTFIDALCFGGGYYLMPNGDKP